MSSLDMVARAGGNAARAAVRRRYAPAALLLIALATAPALGAPGGMCPVDGWSPPDDVFVGNGRVSNSLLLADSAGTVHVFYTETTVGRKKPVDALWYRRLTDGHWSEPRPAIVQPEGVAVHAPAVALDSQGTLHLIFQGPQWGSTTYQSVPIGSVLDRRAWSASKRVSHTSVLNADIAIAPDDTPYIAYSSAAHQLWVVSSADRGASWSDPVQVSRLDPTREATTSPKLVIDARGRLHLVWGQSHLPNGWPPAGVYYARSTDRGRTWSPPMSLAGESYAQPSVAVRGDEVHLVWGAVAAVGHRVHQWSADGGDTWSTPQLINHRLRGGITGASALEFDSAGTLHLVTSVDGPRSIERIMHLAWDGERWSEPELISDGTEADDSVEWPALAITAGRHLHVVYEGDYKRVWYTGEWVDAPEIAPRPVPTPGTDLWSRAQRWSMPFRILLTVLALLILEAMVRGMWRAGRALAG